MRVTNIFTTQRTAQMCARADRHQGFEYVRIDGVVDPKPGEPRFYVLADHEPIEGMVIPGAFPVGWTRV